MLSIGAIASGQGSYYLELSSLAKEDYYLAGVEPPGRWLGHGCERWNLGENVEAEPFLNLMEGYAPDGQGRLVQNAGQETHRPGYDLCFSAPKSVSVLWALSDAKTRSIIEAAHGRAVDAAFSYLEECVAVSRRGKHGTTLEPVQLLAAAFEHGTSRELDPQLHTHVCVANVGIREDGTTGALEARPIFQAKMAMGALYRAELAYQLQQELQVDVERVRSWFEIEGVSEDLCEEFSKRRQQIQEALQSYGMQSARAADVATLDTRSKKESVRRSLLFEHWQAVGEEHGFGKNEAMKLIKGPNQEVRSEPLPDVLSRATERITEQYSHFTEVDAIRFAAEEAQGTGMGAEAVRTAVEQGLRSRDEIVPLGSSRGAERFTTREMLEIEKRLMDNVEQSRQRTDWSVSSSIVESVLDKNPAMAVEQQGALRHITQNPGQYQVVSGMAGTGKTFLLSAAREAWEQAGYHVRGAALAGIAAQGIREGTAKGSPENEGIPSRTIASLLLQHERGKLDWNAKTIVVLDEAGMVGTRQLDKFLSIAQERDTKVVLMGDRRQLSSIEAGGAFGAIGEQVGQATLRDIRRQKETWMRETVHQFADGDAPAALRAYVERGLVTVTPGRREAMEALIRDWKETGVHAPEKTAIIAPTRREVAALNRMAQQVRMEAGALGENHIEVHGETIYENERIRFARNDSLYGISNGQTATVESINQNKRSMRVVLGDEEQRRVTLALDRYDEFTLGYATTVHAVQGGTFDYAKALLGGALQDREISYVEASRARLETRFYVDKAEAGEGLTDIARQMTISHEKTLAISLRNEWEMEHDTGTQIDF